VVLTNFHRFLGSAEIVQTLIHQITAGKQNRTFVIILAPLVQIPVELEKLLVVLEHELPGREQLQQIAQSIATEEGELPQGPELDTVLDSAAGLTRYEAEAAFSLSLVRHGRIAAGAIWELKSGMLKKSGLLSLYRSADTFDRLGGLSSLKAFCKRSLLQSTSGQPHKRARGVLLLGVPGTGKSAFAKSLGKETGRPTLSLDVGSLMASLVGQSEQNIRQALKIADAMAPAILFVDECEKALSGVASSGQTDSGVSARLFGSLLTWMNDHTSDVYLVATCNDISKLPPEFSRAERFDGIFFLNLPGRTEKDAIWGMYQNLFELDTNQRLPADESWTGAEIRSCCRLAALLDVPLVQAAQNVVPVAVTASESIDRLRSWASGRCLDAHQAGIYRREPAATKQTRRNVSRDPSSN
jgi:chloramphenicol 3-O-phosphotransferase